MTEQRPRIKHVVGPDGSPLSINDLPLPSTRRWVVRRKAEVVIAVRGGLLTIEEACKRYTLSVEEYLSWESAVDQHGLAGLRATKIQQYRGSVTMSPSRKLKDVASAYENAKTLANILAESMRRFEVILAELDADVGWQKRYLGSRHIVTDTDLAFVSLQRRRDNIVRSLETLRGRVPIVEEALREATERLGEIRALNSRVFEVEEGGVK